MSSQRQEIVVKIRKKKGRRGAERKSSVLTFLSIALVSSLHALVKQELKLQAPWIFLCSDGA